MTTRAAKSAAADEIADFVGEALERILSRARDSASDVKASVADEAARIGSSAFKKLIDEAEHRPLMMVAIAAGIGFLAGLANRR